MVKYHSDSDWIIKHFRGNRQITARFQELIPDGIGISIMAKAEIYAGVYRFKDWQRRSEETERIYSRVSGDAARRSYRQYLRTGKKPTEGVRKSDRRPRHTNRGYCYTPPGHSAYR